MVREKGSHPAMFSETSVVPVEGVFRLKKDVIKQGDKGNIIHNNFALFDNYFSGFIVLHTRVQGRTSETPV